MGLRRRDPLVRPSHLQCMGLSDWRRDVLVDREPGSGSA